MKWIKKVAATPLTSVAKVVDSLTSGSNERTNAPSIRAVKDALDISWDVVYPIGSIYMSVNNVDPHDLFGGTWQQIKDKFLLACGDAYENGATGGSANHTPQGSVGNTSLTVNQMPIHEHGLDGGVSAQSGYSFMWSETAGAQESFADGSHAIVPARMTSSSANFRSGSKATATGGGQGHNHSFTGISGDYMPPYLSVNVWCRTA